MKSLYKIFVSSILVIAIAVSFVSCQLIKSFIAPEDKDSSSNTDTDSDSSGSDENTPTDDIPSDTPENPDDENDEDDKKPTEDNDDSDKDDSPYLADTSLPHLDYSDVTNGKYTNDIFYANDYDIALGDPSVFYREEANGGWFYVTGTTSGGNFKMWKTRDFTTWKDLGLIYIPSSDFFGVQSFWAPQIIYDEDASWSYYLGEGDGKGLYMLFFSAKDANGMFRLGVAFSKNIEGPYTHFKGTNANGDYIDASISCFEIEKLEGLGLYENHVYGNLYKAGRGFIDASPYIDPVSGDKYLYMVRNRSKDTSNDVWGVKMKDWVTPDYSTTTPLTSYGFTTIDKTESFDFTTRNRIDEGPFLYYKDITNDKVDNGKYYLTFSVGDTNDKFYPVCQAIGDTPLGPFRKLQPDEGGFVITPGELWDIHSSGHHCFFEAGDEMFVGYHTYTINNDTTPRSRYFAMAKVEWVYNEDGTYIMRANGPSKTIQPLPEAVSQYKNITSFANVSTDSSGDVSKLTDGLISLRDNDFSSEFEFTGKTEITLNFKDYITARAIMVYNSYDYDFSFDQIDKIEVSYRKIIKGKYYYGKAYIEDLGFDFKSHLIPQYYLLNSGQTNMNQLRPTAAAIAEFYELEINSLKFEITAPERVASCRISEIVVLGTEEAAKISYSVSKTTPFLNYSTAFSVNRDNSVDAIFTPDGVLDESFWEECENKVTINGTAIDKTTGEAVDIEKYGERSADVYTYISDKYVYFAFEVTDKNLFYHASWPQGRSTAIEIYLASGTAESMADECYSIRINPIADGNFKLGTYIPNAAQNEWDYEPLFENIRVGVKIDGKVQASTPDESYNRDENKGYVIEVAIDKALIGTNFDSIKFTAAFVQMKEYNQTRMDNSFIEGTSYVDVSTWKTVEKEVQK